MTHRPEPAGVYIHWPFCARKCPYCDFHTFGREHPNFDLSDEYTRALLSDLRAAPGRGAEAMGIRAEATGARPAADTIYFGGGTPSLIEPETLAEILAAARGSFLVAADAEITMEVNPTAAETPRLSAARELGVNRLSVGVQSFQDAFLKTLGRDHDAADARRALSLIRELRYDNISLDLMFALPDQTLADLGRDLDAALAFAPEHISIYGLTLHAGTPFRRWSDEGKLTQPVEETQAAQFELIIERLAEADYVHYEISNWCRPGRPSRHNSKYWRECDVHPFGVSAHGVVGGARVSVPRDLAGYIRADHAGASAALPEAPPDSARSALGEIMMLALRRLEGVRWDEIQGWARRWIGPDAPDPRELHAATLRELREEGLIEDDGASIRLTRRGLMIADAVMGRFF